MERVGLYTKKVIEHFKNPHNMGRIRDPDGVGKVGNIVCLIPRTVIYANPKIKFIKDLEKSEKVLSHDGRYHQVGKIFYRDINQKVFLIKNKFGKEILTGDHLVLAVKVPKTHYFSYTQNKKRLAKNPQWYHVTELERQDLIAYPILKKVQDTKKIPTEHKKLKFDFKSRSINKTTKITNDFLRLAGYYLAEGYVTDEITRVRIGFVLNSGEKKIAKDISFLIKKIFKLPVKTHSSKTTSLELYVNSVAMARLFKRLFGKGAGDKHIPHFMMFLPPRKQKNLILSIWRGDGCFQKKRTWPRASFSTISHQLANQIKMLLLRQGIIPSIYEDKEYTKNGVHHQKAYRIHVGERDSVKKLSDILQIPYQSKKPIRVHSWIENDLAFIPITEIKEINYKGKVYNLEVQGARSFTSSALCLHNCGDVMWLYLKVEKNKKGREIIKDVKFETYGCVAALATSSVITDLVKGKTLEDALEFNREEIVKELGGLPAPKLHCSVLAADALYEAIYNYFKKKKRKIPEKLEKAHQRIERDKKEIEKRYKEWIKIEEEMYKK